MLLGDALDDKHATLRGSLPDGSDCFVGWRIVPGVCLFGAVKCNDHNSFRRRVPVQAFCFTAPNNKMIMAIERRQGFADLRSILPYASRVRDCISLRNYVDKRRFYLLAMNCIVAGSPDQNAGDNADEKSVVPFHVSFLPVFQCGRPIRSFSKSQDVVL